MPTPADGFLRDILDRPDDDAVRLIYADWLDDHGDPDRAEFIRLQVERAARGEMTPTPREEALRKKHRATWEAEVPAWARRKVVFERGFVARVQSTALDFLDKAAGLFKRSPIRGVEFRTYDKRAKELGKSEYLSRLNWLTLSGWHGDCFDGPAAKAFFKSPHLGGVRFLDLGGCPIGPDGAKALAASSLAAVATLLVNGADLGPKGVADLAKAKSLAALTTLNLGYNALGDKGASALADSPAMATLRELQIWNNGVTARGLRPLAAAAPTLAVLSLARNAVFDAGAILLAGSARSASLVELDLEGNGLTEAGVRALAASPHLDGLTVLSLERNAVGDAGAVALAESPRLGSLRVLNLREAGVEDDGARALATSNRLARLARLDLLYGTKFDPATRKLLLDRFGEDGVVMTGR